MNKAERRQRRREIRSIMVKKGIIAAEIARQLNVTRQHVNFVIAGDRYSPRVVKALIEAGVPAELLTPEEDNSLGIAQSGACHAK